MQWSYIRTYAGWFLPAYRRIYLSVEPLRALKMRF